VARGAVHLRVGDQRTDELSARPRPSPRAAWVRALIDEQAELGAVRPSLDVEIADPETGRVAGRRRGVLAGRPPAPAGLTGRAGARPGRGRSLPARRAGLRGFSPPSTPRSAPRAGATRWPPAIATKPSLGVGEPSSMRAAPTVGREPPGPGRRGTDRRPALHPPNSWAAPANARPCRVGSPEGPRSRRSMRSSSPDHPTDGDLHPAVRVRLPSCRPRGRPSRADAPALGGPDRGHRGSRSRRRA
jgi:hypothetical protein